LHVLSHEEEAFLTIIGVTEGMPVTHETLVVDVGWRQFGILHRRRDAAASRGGSPAGSARSDRPVRHA
jgi:hypothetical protein